MRGMFGMAALVFASLLTSGVCGAADTVLNDRSVAMGLWHTRSGSADGEYRIGQSGGAACRGGAQAASDDGTLKHLPGSIGEFTLT